MDGARFLPRSALATLRADRDLAWQGAGVWVTGALECLGRPCVAIVGTRAATRYGASHARRIARDLAASGCCIISGLALGIDAAAHEGALDADAPTVGVLGSGHERFFPPRNAGLGERMLARGAVISAYEPTHMAYPSQFLERNALVAALADAVLVIEAPARSGALNTAHWAAPRIPVLALPGDVDRAHVAGCHALIRDGAILARDAGDVLEVLRVAPLPLHAASARSGLAARIIEILRDGEAPLDAIVARIDASAAEIIAELSLLELDNAVERRGASFALLP